MAQFQDRDSLAPGIPFKQRTVENAEVAEPGPAHAAMASELKRITTLLGGTEAMRAAKTEYLPQHMYEPNDAYKRRLDMTYLDNYTLKTLDTLVGKAFNDPPMPGEDMPEPIVDLLDDVDDAGTGLVRFSREWFRSGVEQAVAYCLIEQPDGPARSDGAPRTKEDDIKDGIRPQWRLVRGSDMLDYQEGKVNGKTVPTMVRFRDDYLKSSQTGFKTSLQQRIRVFRHTDAMPTHEEWELQEGPRGGKPKWVNVAGPDLIGMERIPIVPFYTDKTGPGEGRPRLSTIAHLNVRHWQSTSDQINILTVTRFPILAASGVREAEGEGSGGQLVVGPNKFLTTPDPQSKVYYVEHTGAAVESGRNELIDLGEAMAAHGAEFMRKGAQGPETASGRILDAGEAISPLKAWGLDFKDCLEMACWLTAQWMGLGEVDTPVQFEVEEEVDMANPTEVTSLDAARTRKDISRKAWIEEALLRGIIKHEDFDMDADQELIDEEVPADGGLNGMQTGLGGVGTPKNKPAAPVKKPVPKKK
jgi:hypothetical protein